MRLDFETSAVETESSVVSDFDFSSDSASDYSQKIRAGIQAAREGSRSEARRLLLEAADDVPSDENVWLQLASISEYPEELLGFLNNALRVNPGNERTLAWAKATEKLLAESFVERGERAAQSNQTDFARQCFRQAIALVADAEAAWLGLAQSAESEAEKSALFERVLTVNAENERALTALAEMKARAVERFMAKASAEALAGDGGAARETLAEVFSQTAESEEAWLLKAFLTDSFDEKNECWTTVLRLNPENELARSSTAFVRSLQSKTVSPFERESSEMTEFGERENDFFVEENVEENFAFEESTIENTIDLSKIYAEFSVAEPEDASVSETSEDDSENFEISVSADDSHGYYEIEEEIFAASPAVEELNGSEEWFADETVEEIQTEAPAENQAFAEPAFSRNGENEEMKNERMENNFEATAARAIFCPFCSRENEPQTFVCPSCMAVLSLSDLEMLLSHRDANREIVRQAVERMQAENDSFGSDAERLKSLGIGQINLKNFRDGFSYLQKAAQANPNDVVFGSQVNALAIRLAEIEAQADIHSSLAKNKTILVVDDSATVRKLISGKLEKSGHSVLCAVDGMDAMEKIEASVPDLILLDITMPRMDGYQVCKMIRTNERTKDIPVVMISGKDGFFDKVRGRMAGTTGYITKPFGPETLMKTVESYIV